MDSLTDQQLLRDYAERRSESAFAELVRRHVDLVYSAALRMVCDAHLAEDVAQGSFVALAQNARKLSDRPVLSGWLHRTARNLAANVVRTDVRRRAREQEAAAMNELLSAEPEAAWEKIAPYLDAALDALNEPDREALLLRYFERKSAHDIARTFGISDDAAQKRVSRAVERLREFFSKRGVGIGASGLVVLISANAVQSAPIALISTISAASVLAGTTIHTSTAIATTKVIAMTTLQKTLVTATLAVVAGAGIYEAHQASQLREQVKTVQRQQEALNEQIRQLQHERDDANAENERLHNNIAALNNRRVEQQTQTNVGPTKVQSLDVSAPAKPEAKSIRLSKDSWTNAGFATTEAALKTRGWAVLNGNRERFSQSVSITPQARKLMEDMLIEMAKASNDPNKEQFLQAVLDNKLGVEEAILMPLVALNKEKEFTGYNILSQQRISPEEMILDVETEMISAPPETETLKFQRFGNDWKIVVDEAFVKSMH